MKFDLRAWSATAFLFVLASAEFVAARGADLQAAASGHWSFQPLRPPAAGPARGKSPIDFLLRQRLAALGLKPSPEADRETLIRRASFILTGLPPTPEEIERRLADRNPGAHERMVDGYLASPRYGERWGKLWLDAAGYADSNGYFNADSDRPLAWRYRDYVIRAVNRDLPFDRFVREQLAGDELSGWKPGAPASPETIELLEATHFLRNGQDGSGESDGNPDEVRADRYYALESAMQIIGSSLLGLTMQCAKCHDHKFEPITQKDYFAFQAFLYPAFNIEKWSKPNDRVAQANLPGELEAWSAREKNLDERLRALKDDFSNWATAHRPAGKILFRDEFDSASLRPRWSNVAPGDDAPGGAPPVNLDSANSPAALIKDGNLRIIESGAGGDRWISTARSFAWKPAARGDWIQATFDLVAAKLDETGPDAARVAYFIAQHDFDHSGGRSGGNILIDGNPTGPGGVHLAYPGPGSKSLGEVAAPYKTGRNYGVRVTNSGHGKFALEHLVDGQVDGKAIALKGDDLPDGGFGFEYCCGRSFVVDNVVVESSNTSDAEWARASAAFQKEHAAKKDALEKESKSIAASRTSKPGRIAWMTDAGPDAPEVRLLKRGNHKTPGDLVEPRFLEFLAHGQAPAIERRAATTGRRLAWAEWITNPASPQGALLARVTANRIWQNCFGSGIVNTPDNLGLSGAPPSHPELLEWLAFEFVRGGWSQKALLRKILLSDAFRQSSLPHPRGLARDPSNQLLWRFPAQRLDAESIRDAMLFASGRLSPKTNGVYVPTHRTGDGEVVVDESTPDGLARAVFLQHRRTQVPAFLAAFDAPSIVFNCVARSHTTMPLQSLSLLNSDFALKRAGDLAARVRDECPDEAPRVRRAFLRAVGRAPSKAEQKLALEFLAAQRGIYGEKPGDDARAWADFCQSLFASNHFLYLQ